MSFNFSSDPTVNSAIVRLFEVYASGGFECFLVGGAVRDIKCNKTPKDFDFATNAPYEFTKTSFEKTIDTGIAHGTITVVIDGNQFEVTRFRTDANHDGRHCEISFADTIEIDLSRRDFRFNAMAMNANGDLIDPFNGLEDLQNNIVRFVGNADERIKEDYLRILRFFRFFGRFGNGNLEYETWFAIRNNVSGLKNISRERVWSEFQKFLPQENSDKLMFNINLLGIFNWITDPQNIDIIQPHQREFNDLKQAKEVTSDPAVLMAASCKFDRLSIEVVAKDWKWSNSEKEHALWLCDHMNKKCDLRWLIAIDNAPREWVIELAALEQRDGWEQNALAHWQFNPFPINGTDLIAMGFKPGIAMGVTLRNLKEAWGRSGFSATKDELLAKLKEMQ